VTYGGGGEEGGEAGPPLPGPGGRRGAGDGVEGQHRLQGRGEAARERVPLPVPGERGAQGAGEVGRRGGRRLWGRGQVQGDVGEGGVGGGVGGGDTNRHATASATVGDGLQAGGGVRNKQTHAKYKNKQVKQGIKTN